MQITPITTPYLDASRAVVTQAFATADHASGTEADIVLKLRQSKNYDADYDVIALDGEAVVGLAMLSKALIADTTPVWVLAPLAVRPDHQRLGIGGALITYLEVQAGKDGRRAISILGDPAYYGRFGYQPASKFGIQPPYPDVDKYFLIKELIPGGLNGVSGTLVYNPAFD